MRSWKCLSAGMLVCLCASAAVATDEAADKFAKSARSTPKLGSAQQRAIDEFDTDGDGKLNATERRAARMALANRKRAAQSDENPSSSGLASSSGSSMYPNGMNSNGMNPYATGTGNYPMGMNPYASGSGSYFYYSTGVFSQMSPQTTMGSGTGGCMQMGSTGGRR